MPIPTIQNESEATFARYQVIVEQACKMNIGTTVFVGPKANRRGQENEQTNDTGRNRTYPAEAKKLRGDKDEQLRAIRLANELLQR